MKLTVKEFLRCDFTEPELKEFSLTIAREISGLSRAEEEKKVANAQFTQTIESHKAQCAQLARNINTGYEMRMVECAVELDKPSKGLARLVRTDTGEEVKVRPMSPEERQMTLPLEGKTKEAKA